MVCRTRLRRPRPLECARSPAINVSAPTTLNNDQRGYPRTVGGAPDIGAVELQTPFLVVTADSNNSNTNTLRNILARADPGTTITFTNSPTPSPANEPSPRTKRRGR